MHEIRWTNEIIAKLWSYYSTNPGIQSQYFSHNAGQYILEYIDAYVKLNTLHHVLDFGCGPGYLLDHLLKIVKGECYGLEFSKTAVDEVNQRLKNNPTFKGAVCVTNLPSPFKDDSMDMVISVEVIEHLNDEQLMGMLKDIYRILRPGGFIVITTPNGENLEANKTMCPECGCVFHRWQHVRSWNSESIKKIMDSTGFKTSIVSETFFQPKSQNYKDRIRGLLFRNAVFLKPHLIYIGQKDK